ncbi:MAG: hypothetical protein QF793_02995 [Candidatus Peribacteraceae bacterium]|jgi:hypothetical protein|nr:hypothetical protein [Candidatus Peribacteraceae bacterium]|tara:strand:+ start:1683 stop:3113 length:1431 start_codon:yes stop_codon:yes gene_type:complete
MLTKIKIIFTLTLLALSGQAFAQSAPSAVTGLDAQVFQGEIVVQWDAVTSDPIDYYRVYYSGESILDNEGLYDDFEVTQEDETTLSFLPPLGATELYIAVIAVSINGMESEFFTDEARLELDSEPLPPTGVFKDYDEDKPAEQQPPTMMPPTAAVGATARLLKGAVVSPEKIVIEFSASMTVDSKRAPEGLKIEGPGSTSLQIKNITLEAKSITIITETQERGTVYNVQFSEPFEGRAGQPLDLDDRSVLITGHIDGKDPVPPVPPPPPPREVDPMTPPDLQNVTIVPELQANGGYTITLTWNIDNTPGDLYGIVAYQTRDGQTFGPPNLLPIDVSGVQLADVTPGFFGIYLQTVNTYGYVSSGVFQYVTLPVYVPGYGFYGDLTFGGMNAGEDINFDAVEEEEEVPTDMATIDAITDDTPTEALEGVDHSAAFDESTLQINWKLVTLVASAVAVFVILVVGYIALTSKKNGSADA